MFGLGSFLLYSLGGALLSSGINALSPAQKVEQGRVDSLVSGNGVAYGSIIPWGWGTVRLPGSKIWLDYLEEDRNTESTGGGLFGLAPKTKVTTFDYYGFWAELFAECPFRPALDYQRIWMNKKLVYSTIGGALTIAEGGRLAQEYLNLYRGYPNQPIDPLLNNRLPIANYNYGLPGTRAKRDEFLRANGIDPDNTALSPAYNHRVYFVAYRMPLGDFYSSIPSCEAEIIFSNDCTLGQIVGDLFSLYFEPDRYDTSLLTTPVKGYSISSKAAATNAIQELQQAYLFDIVDSNGVIKFVPLNSPKTLVNLDLVDLAPHTGTSKPVDFEIIETDPATLPSKVIVSYLDPNLNYDSATQESTFEIKGHYNPNEITLNLNLVLDGSEAATIADRALIQSWTEKFIYKFKLPPAYLDLEIGDLVSNIFDDRNLAIKLTKLRLGANLIIEAEGIGHDPYFWNLTRQLVAGGVTLGVADYTVIIEVVGAPISVADSAGNIYTEGTDYTIDEDQNIQLLSGGNIPSGTNLIVSTSTEPEPDPATTGSIAPVVDVELIPLDIPLLNELDPTYPLYLAASGECSVYLSFDNARYIYATAIDRQNTYGLVEEFSQGGLRVRTNSQLESVSTSDLTLGYNLALVGEQIIQFQTATPVLNSTFELSNLEFNLKGTTEASDPQAGDLFVLLRGLEKISLGEPQLNQTIYLKAVAPSQVLASVEAVSLVYRGVATRPYAPQNIAASKNAIGDILISWEINKKNPPGIKEDLPSWNLEIQRPNGEKVREVVVNSNTYNYSLANQKADFGSAMASLTVQIAQVSPQPGAIARSTLTPIYLEPAPAIVSFEPASASVEQVVTLIGSNLASLSSVKVGGVEQSHLAVADNNKISFKIVPGTNSGTIALTTNGGQIQSSTALVIENYKSQSDYIFVPRSLNAADANKILNCDSVEPLNLTLDKSLVFPGFQCTIRQKGTGQIVLDVLSEDTLEAIGNTLNTQYTAAFVSYQNNGVWIALGALWAFWKIAAKIGTPNNRWILIKFVILIKIFFASISKYHG